ncbi:glycosyltransferase family 39 protein [Terrarubrum flagellatum]|uniref:ArnT family glycosyltransferase n=1 Tax=Terrirubrum flagellatum TaxID=2895980 RepID=UPI0031451D01
MNALLRASDQLLVFAARSHMRAVLVLLVAAILSFVPGLFIMQPMDRDEPRFAQATKQMLESGDFVNIRFRDEARNKKPVGIYWLQAAAVSIGEKLGVDDARRRVWLYRLPSLAGAIAATLLSYWAALIMLGRREAVAAALLFGATILMGVEARLAKTDGVMCATAVVAFGILARLWTSRRTTSIQTWETFLFWAAIGVSVLLKGPVIAGVFALAAATLAIRERSAAWLKPIVDWRAIIMAILIVSPWFILIATKTGGDFFIDAIRNDMLGKVAGGQEMHGAPPGVYTLISPAIFWPASALFLLALPWFWRSRREDLVVLCLAWIIPAWIMFEAIPTKLPHYVLPLLPAIAILSTRALAEGQLAPERWNAKIAIALLPLMPLLFAAAAIAAVFILESGGATRFLPMASAAPLFALAIILAMLAAFAVNRGARLAVAPIAAAATIALSWSVYQFAWPALRSIQLSPRLATAASAAGCASPKYATIGGYDEPSLVFLTDGSLKMTNGAGGADFMAGEGCRIAFVDVREEPAFLAGLRDKGVAPLLLTRVEGVNINRAMERDRKTLRVMDMGVYMRDTTRP